MAVIKNILPQSTVLSTLIIYVNMEIFKNLRENFIQKKYAQLKIVRKKRNSSRGFCDKHYGRFMMHDDANYVNTKRLSPIKNRGCKVDGCDQKHEAKNLCHKHYGKQYRSKHKLDK